MLEALDALPEKILIAEDLVDRDGRVCALGAVGKKRGLDMAGVDPEDRDAVAKLFGIAPALAAEIAFLNDGWFSAMEWPLPVGAEYTPAHRFIKMRKWAEENLKP
jgi:hypothetical protein